MNDVELQGNDVAQIKFAMKDKNYLVIRSPVDRTSATRALCFTPNRYLFNHTV